MENLGGANGSFFGCDGLYKIVLKADDSELAKAFTLGHELREIIGDQVRVLRHRFKDAKGEDLETEADVFASTLLLGKEAFSVKAVETGYDPLHLGYMYHTSYRTALFRMFRLFFNEERPPLFWATVFSVKGSSQAAHVRTIMSLRSPRFSSISRDQPPNLLFPKRGQLFRMTPNVLRSLKYEKSVYIDSAYGLDFSSDHCLSVLIRPHATGEEIDRLIVLAVPHEENSILSSQIQRARPIRIEQEFQLP